VTIIATRLLKLREANGEVEIPIRIHTPEREQPGVWGCRYDVGLRGSVLRRLGGSIQAILVALLMIGAEIYSSDYHKSGHLFWREPGKGYGFPVVPTLRDLLQGDDAKYL
jgi:hypothetical protein